MSKEGDLQVWHIPQIPMHPFYVNVKNVDEAILIIKTLAEYDKFQLENNIKPDYSSASGLMVYEDDDWTEWYDTETDDDIWEIIWNTQESENENESTE